ncbi:hemopexin-like isoform X3 [Narcine bancroftii]|uniref:hemopexin-like isoform X3 n=1 Tax=Narcine bancroftii TaxID=1343680 RepID=UPI003831256A
MSGCVYIAWRYIFSPSTNSAQTEPRDTMKSLLWELCLCSVLAFTSSHPWLKGRKNITLDMTTPPEPRIPGFPDRCDGLGFNAITLDNDGVSYFFRGNAIFVLDLTTNKMKEKLWPRVRGCTALMKWIDKYYCFRGTYFLRFNPITGHVAPQYPKDSRDYFMRCKGRGHWSKNSTVDRNIFNSCSNLSYDEFTQDQLGRIYAFRGNWYFRPDLKRDGRHPWSLNSSWPSLHGKVDGVFNWDHKMYFIKGPQLFIYKAEGSYSLIDGYPKPVEEELGITDSHIDATFVCPHTSLLYVIQGNHMRVINLEQTPRVLGNGTRISHSQVDGAMCNNLGVYLFIGTQYYLYDSPAHIASWTKPPSPKSIKEDFMACSH